MNKQWTFWAALVLAIAFVLGIWIAGSTYLSVRKQRIVSVTGNAEQDFESDLIVWTASFRVQRATLGDAYTEIERERAVVQDYLKQSGLKPDGYSFGSLDVSQSYSSGYDTHGNYQQVPNGYVLTQSVTITSGDLDGVEELSKSISSLISQGVEITSQAPDYYYTNLDDLKHQMLRQASEDALDRAEEIASGSRGKVGKLQNASMGVFQIVGKNAGEDYSWGGAFNTSSRQKTISVTVRATYTLR